MGYKTLRILLDIHCNAIGYTPTHYDTLIIKGFDEVVIDTDALSYSQLMQVCNAVSVMTDSVTLRIFQKIKGIDVGY